MTSPPCDITLYLPGLLGPQSVYPQLTKADKPDLTLLETLLSRAARDTGPASDWLTGVFALFNLDGDERGSPVAAVTAAYDGLDASEGYWFRADPVYLQPDRTQAVLVASDALQLQADECEALLQTLNEHFAEDGWQFFVPHPQRWYLRLDEAEAIRTTPLHEVMGQSVQEHLPSGDKQREWHNRLNELQMLLHNHEVNANRVAAGRMPVNSVWFWGEGELPKISSMPWDRVYSDHDVVVALAQLGKVEYSPLTDFDVNTLKGRNLVVMPECYATVQSRDVFQWLECLKSVQAQYLAPLLAGLRRGYINSMNLVPVNGHEYRIGRKQLRRWWQRRRSLETFLTP